MLVASGAIAAVNGFSLISLVAVVCGAVIAGVPGTSYRKGIESAPLQDKSEVKEKEEIEQELVKRLDAFNYQKAVKLPRRLYRKNQITRINAGLLAQSSFLVVGSEGIGKTVVGLAVKKNLEDGGFRFAFIESGSSTKSALINICTQLEIETSSIEGKPLTTEQLKNAVTEFLDENPSVLIIDDCHRFDTNFRYWLKKLRSLRVPMLLLATNPPKTDIFFNVARIELEPLPDYAIREIMEQMALDISFNLKNSDLARLQQYAGGNPMLCQRAIEQEYLGNETDADAGDHNRYVDITPVILIAGLIFMVFRFIGLGTNNRTLYLVSGIGAVIFMGFSRLLYSLPKESRRFERR